MSHFIVSKRLLCQNQEHIMFQAQCVDLGNNGINKDSIQFYLETKWLSLYEVV